MLKIEPYAVVPEAGVSLLVLETEEQHLLHECEPGILAVPLLLLLLLNCILIHLFVLFKCTLHKNPRNSPLPSWAGGASAPAPLIFPCWVSHFLKCNHTWFTVINPSRVSMRWPVQWQVKVELEPISSPTAVHFTQLSITWCLPTLQDSTGLKQRNHADIPCLFMMEMLAPIRQFLSDPGKPDWETLCRLNWCDSGWWRYQLNTNW